MLEAPNKNEHNSTFAVCAMRMTILVLILFCIQFLFSIAYRLSVIVLFTENLP